MAMTKAKPGRTRNEALSLRIDPKLRYRLDLVASIEDRTITSVIDRMASSYYDDVMTREVPVWFMDMPGLKDVFDKGLRYSQLEKLLWSDDEAIRSLRYYISYPDKMNARERVVSKVLLSKMFRGNDRIWDDEDLASAFIKTKPSEGSAFYTTVNLKRIHDFWATVNDAADEVMETGLYKSINDLTEGDA